MTISILLLIVSRNIKKYIQRVRQEINPIASHPPINPGFSLKKQLLFFHSPARISFLNDVEIQKISGCTSYINVLQIPVITFFYKKIDFVFNALNKNVNRLEFEWK